MKLWKSLCGLSLVSALVLVGCQALEGFNYPTKTDTNNLAAQEVEHRRAIAEELAKLMTDQHGEMQPSVKAALELMTEQYNSVSAELAVTAAAMKAEGVDGTELAALIAVAFPGLGGLGLWLREKTKPSRSAEEVEKLKSDASDAKEKMHAMELVLATAAGAGKSIPSDT